MCKHLIWMGSNDNGEWIDHTFVDKAANCDKREWRLSVSTRTGEAYSTLLRSAHADGEFDMSVDLPRKITAMLMSCI